jgi:hypothetical protein
MSSVSSVSSSLNQYQVNLQNTLKQLQQDFSNLGTALQSGDLAGVQTPFSTLLQSISASDLTQTGQQSGTTITADFAALGQALQSGDVNAAKTAFTQLQQDLQSVHGHHHHHHHHAQATGAQSTSTNSVTDLLQTTSSGGTTSGTLNITA